MKKIDFKNSSFVIFLIISLFYAINNFIWWFINTPIIPVSISAYHFNEIFTNTFYSAPLMTWIMNGMLFIFGKEYFDLQIIFVNYIFFLAALYFIYKIGLELQDKKTGNIAMILFALTPIIYGMSRHYGHQHWHLMVLMTANIYCLIKLNDFKNRKWCILYGITTGLGLLMKDAFVAYFFTPWLYVVMRSLIDKIDKNKIINILLTIVLGSLIAGCHYFRQEIIWKIIKEPVIETESVFSFESLRITTIGLSEYLLSPPILLLFIVSIIYFIYNKNIKNKVTILLWLVIPWLIITFMPHHKEFEYCVGLVPVIILIISVFMSHINRYLVLFTICILLVQYICFFYSKNNERFDIKDTKIKYYDCSAMNKFAMMQKEELRFYFELVHYIDKLSSTRIVLLNLEGMSIETLNLIANISCQKEIKIYDFINLKWMLEEQDTLSFDVFLSNDFANENAFEIVKKEYMYYFNSPLQNYDSKKTYVDKRIKEIEKIINFIKDNFILVKNISHGNLVIQVYKLSS